MMKTKKILSLLVAALFTCLSCEKAGAGLKDLVLTLSADTVELSLESSRAGENVLTVSWSGGSRKADYSVLMDICGNGFENADVNVLGKCTRNSYSISSRDLNMLIAELWPEVLSKTATFEIKVMATLDGQTVESNTATVSIKSYGSTVDNLYVIGSATSGGWLLGAAQKMNKRPGGIFTWKGRLTTGEIKFLLSRNSWDNFYGYGGDDHTLIYHPEGMSGDPKFQITQLGEYEIELNTIELTIDIVLVKEISARVVFLGDSITDCWDDNRTFFQDNGFVNSGISGETTGQMLDRVNTQVVAYKPEVVVFLGGVNDIARNQGYISNDDIMKNIREIAVRCDDSGAKLILCSILPINDIYWNKSIIIADARELILDMNRRIKDFCDENNYYFCDYFTLMSDGNGGINSQYTNDGLHPNAKGYAVMEPFILSIVNEALKQ